MLPESKFYYFSGTGNCLQAARFIAEKTKAKLIPVRAVIVERFVKKLGNMESKHIFAVCTCGGYESVNALPALRNLAALLRSKGAKLAAEYSVRFPMNNLDYNHLPVPIIRDQDTIIRKGKKKLEAICLRLLRGKGTRFRLPKAFFNLLMALVYRAMKGSCLRALRERAGEAESNTLSFRELIPLTDRSIRVDAACNACGVCARVCPAQNIELVNERPVWKHQCEMCLGCDEWCPRNAIQHWGRARGIKYHHPGASAGDMMLSEEKGTG